MTCLILSDISKADALTKTYQSEKALIAAHMLTLAEVPSIVIGGEICDKESTVDYDAYNGLDGWRWDFTRKAIEKIRKEGSSEDIIVLTEPWHRSCFDGPIINNKFEKFKLVEMWTREVSSPTKYRIFDSRFSRQYVSILEGNIPVLNWEVIYPIIDPEDQPEIKPVILTISEDKNANNLFNVDFIRQMAAGFPVIAPDWGVWQEIIQSGFNGFLYRTEAGKQKAEKRLGELLIDNIVESVNSIKEESIIRLSNFIETVKNDR